MATWNEAGALALALIMVGFRDLMESKRLRTASTSRMSCSWTGLPVTGVAICEGSAKPRSSLPSTLRPNAYLRKVIRSFFPGCRQS